MAEIKKPFKETKVGEWITKNVPNAIGLIENFVPAPVKGGLDIVKNIIQGSTLTDEQKAEGIKLADDHEIEIIKLDQEQAKIDNENTDSARKMNISLEGDKPSWMAKNVLYILALFVSAIWGIMTIYLLMRALKFVGDGDKVDLTQILCIYNGISVMFAMVLNFFFGSTQNGRQMQKTMMDKIPDPD